MKKRSLAGFGDVAGSNNNDNTNVNVNDNIIDNVIVKEKTKKLVGIYFEHDVAAVLERLGKQGGRGAQSKIVNDIVKQYFQQSGYLEE